MRDSDTRDDDRLLPIVAATSASARRDLALTTHGGLRKQDLSSTLFPTRSRRGLIFTGIRSSRG